MGSVESAIHNYYGDLRRYARVLSKGRMDSEELVQDCMVRALARPHFWERVDNPRAYLFAILHNTYVDTLSTLRRQRALTGYEEADPYLVSPPAQISMLELQDVAEALGRLPPNQRVAVTCVSLDGMSYREAADHIGVPIGTVMSRISRARCALRDLTDGLAKGRA